MAIHISSSPEDTHRLGEALGSSSGPGDLIGLIGDLGAGKTQFVKGIARGLGITERIHSPTFALVNEYHQGRLPCYHLDLYRLESAAQILGAGLEEYLYQGRGVTVVEWFDRWLEAKLPPPTRATVVTIIPEGESQRRITYENIGA